MSEKEKNEQAGGGNEELLDEALKNFKKGFEFLNRYCVEEAAPAVGEAAKKGLESAKEILSEIGDQIEKATETVKEEFRKATEDKDDKDK